MINHRRLSNDLCCDEERKFTSKVRRILTAENPNPDRIGCSALSRDIKALAWHGTLQNGLDQILDHLMLCSPCFRDHHKYKRQYKIHRWLRDIGWPMSLSLRAKVIWGSAGLLFMFTLSLIWTYQKEGRPNNGKHVGSETEQVARSILDPTKGTPIEHGVVSLTLQSNFRGGGPAEGETRITPLVLPHGRLSLVVQLPKGAREGKYLVRLASEDRVLIQAEGQAITDQSNISRLELPNFDTSRIPAGKYQLAFKKDQLDWAEFEVTVK